MKKRIALLLAVCLFIGSPLMAFATKPEVAGMPSHVITPLYLNLGDSIAYGMSAAPGESYFDLFAEYLEVGPAMNLGVPGATTGDLLDALGKKEYQRAVRRADIITISIGGNNLLRPVIEAAFEAYDLDYNGFSDPEAAMSTLYGAVYQAETLIPGTWNAIMNGLLASALSTTSGSLGYYLEAGASSFVDDWDDIIGSIRGMNPNATIIALNLYNPVNPPTNPPVNPPVSLEDALFHLFDDIFSSLNWNITNQYYQAKYNYQVVDVKSAFANDRGAVGFTVNPVSLNLDPHPTTTGHNIIFGLLAHYAEMRAFQPGKPEGVGKASESVVEDLQVNDVGGLPAAHEEASGDPLSDDAFGQAVSNLARKDPSELVQHVKSR